jgi:hypothetical protein
MAEPLTKLEEDLLRVPGVRSARVIGGEVPSEIHVVATSRRSPKQVVRDVQSLAAAGFGMPIDHRIVSVVQLDDPVPAATEAAAPENSTDPARPIREDPVQPEETIRLDEPTPTGGSTNNLHRPVLERVVLASKGDTGWVKVALKWPDGSTTEGAGSAGASRDARARGASAALLQALKPALDPIGAKIDVDHVIVHRIGSMDSVFVQAMFFEKGTVTPLVGSALVYDDVASAAVRAILQAVNRKVRLP